MPCRPRSQSPDRIPNWCDKVPGSVPFLRSGFLKCRSDLFLPSFCPFVCYSFHNHVRFKWGKKKKKKKKEKSLDIRRPDIIMIAEYWPWPHGGREWEVESNIKKLSFKATVAARMKSIAARQLSSCKIIAQSPLLRRHGFRVQKEMGLPVEAFRSCHSEKHDSNAKNNVCL